MRRVSSEDGVDLDRYTNVPLKAAPTRYSDPRAHELRAEYLVTFHADEVPVPVESIAEDLLGLRIEERDLGDCSGMLVPSERLIVVNAAEATNGETPTRRHRFTIAHAVPLGLPRAAGRGGREDELDEYAVGSRAEAMHVVALAHRLTRLATAPKSRPSAAECGVAPTRHSCRPSVAGSPSNSPPSATARGHQRNSRHHPARRAKNPESDVIATRQTSPDAVWNINHVARETQEVGGFAFVVHRSSRPAPSTPPTARRSRTGGCARSARRVLVRGA